LVIILKRSIAFILLGLREYLTPFIPLFLKGEGEETLERSEAPLSPTLPLPWIREEGQGDRLTNNL